MNKAMIATQQQMAPKPFFPVQTSILQRKCACGNHTIAGSECTDCAKKKIGLQRKLTISASNDPLEQEADRIAGQVMASPSYGAVSSIPVRIQRFTGNSSGQITEAPASVEQVLASPGRPLEPGLREEMEGRFGYDFSQVRVHTGGAAEQSAREVNANAYTVGNNVVFGAGQFTPGEFEGRRLIAHELIHVIQQHGLKLQKRILQMQRGVRMLSSRRERQLRAWARLPANFVDSWQEEGLSEDERSVVILAMDEYYGSDFTNRFVQLANTGQLRRSYFETSSRETRLGTLTPARLHTLGYRLALLSDRTLISRSEVWVHPSGSEIWIGSRQEEEREQDIQSRCSGPCIDRSNSQEECHACCQSIPDTDVRCRRVCEVACAMPNLLW